MTTRTRRYFRRRIQRKYLALTAITTAMGASQLYAIKQQPLPKYPLGTPMKEGYVLDDGPGIEAYHPVLNYIKGGTHTGGIAMVGERGAELVLPPKESTAIARMNKLLDIQQSVVNTAFALQGIMKEMQDKTKRYK